MIRYLGIANIAKLKWCHQYFKYTSRQDEEGFKRQYLRLKNKGGEIIRPAYDYRTKYKPGKVIKLKSLLGLDVFDFLRLFDYSLFTGRNRKYLNGSYPIITSSDEFYLREGYIDIPEVDKKYIRDSFESSFKKWLGKLLKNKILEVYIPGEWRDLPWRVSCYRYQQINPYLLLGRDYELCKAEQYPIHRKIFQYRKYILIGAPDGVTDAFCYEFKTVKNNFFYKFTKSIVQAQVILYSYLFKRPQIRFQIHNQKNDRVDTFQENLDPSGAETLLEIADKLLNNQIKSIPPKGFKCSTCQFSSKCRIKKEAH